MDVFGSYFPAWLISLAAGIVLTVIAGSVGRLMGYETVWPSKFSPQHQPDTDFQYFRMVLFLRELNI